MPPPSQTVGALKSNSSCIPDLPVVGRAFRKMNRAKTWNLLEKQWGQQPAKLQTTLLYPRGYSIIYFTTIFRIHIYHIN